MPERAGITEAVYAASFGVRNARTGSKRLLHRGSSLQGAELMRLHLILFARGFRRCNDSSASAQGGLWVLAYDSVRMCSVKSPCTKLKRYLLSRPLRENDLDAAGAASIW